MCQTRSYFLIVGWNCPDIRRILNFTKIIPALIIEVLPIYIDYLDYKISGLHIPQSLNTLVEATPL